jgi:hypothetical protein
MTDAPERIWADPPQIFDGSDVWHSEPANERTEYIRADIAEAEKRAAVADALEMMDVSPYFQTVAALLLRHGPMVVEQKDKIDSRYATISQTDNLDGTTTFSASIRLEDKA